MTLRACVLLPAYVLLAYGQLAYGQVRTVVDTDPVRIACVGDSITEGNANAKPALNSWPVQLGQMLAQRNSGRWVVRNFGKSGATLLKKGHRPYWDQAQFADALAFQPNVVVINLGTNDATARNWIHSAEFADNYRELIDRFATLPSKPRILLSNLTPIFPNFSRYLELLERREEAVFFIMQVAAEKRLTVINLHTPLRGLPEFSPDGLHPSPAGNTIMAAEVYRVITGEEADLSEHRPRPVTGSTAQLIQGGVAKRVYSSWTEHDGFMGGSGRLLAGVNVTHGDFHLRANLRMESQESSAAAFMFKGSHFGFEGARGTLFHNGSIFGRQRLLAASTSVFERGAWIDFEVIRNGQVLWFLINGKIVDWAHFMEDKVSGIGFRPQRSTMQIRDFTITGNMEAIDPPAPSGYTIPLIDLANQQHRQAIVDREPGQYLGHPTTVLLADGSTIIAVYPKGHGHGAIVMKRSRDGGLTWSNRLPTPDSWKTSKEVPTIYRVTDPVSGRNRLIMFSGLYPIRMARSEDDGETWSELEPIGDFGGIVANACLLQLKNGDYVSMFHDDGRFIHGTGRSTGVFALYQLVSSDGGLTWSDPEKIWSGTDVHLCEPGIVRSPDGGQIAMLLRENSRTRNAHVMYSDNEARSWSEPRELPGALTGDRHTAVYAPDGRLFVSFRDTTLESPTQGDWVAWVGTYDDIVQGREGQYRVRLMDNKNRWDCAYPGVVILPDGTIVTTTYGHWTDGEQPYIVSVRLRLEELDAIAHEMIKHED